jgi:hypothetical protein
MSTDFSIRPVGSPAPAPAIPPAVSQAVDSGVATQLPPSQSVTVAGASAGLGDNSAASSVSISRQAYIDQAAASIVFQVIDTKTDSVVQQYPDDAILRRRAYFHTLDLTKGEPTRVLATDRKA